MPSSFDPDGAAVGDGIYGLPTPPDEARFVLVPVPVDATASSRRGTAGGPVAILRASRQVDLFDLQTGRPWESGIAMLALPEELRAANELAAAEAAPVIAAGGPGDDPELRSAAARVDAFGDAVNRWVGARAEEVLARDAIPVVVGGDHSTPFGAIAAVARRHPGVGVLHVDAHADLRVAYEGFTWSHASILHNVVERIGGVARVVQVALRDIATSEHARIGGSGGRIVAFPDAELHRARFDGRPWSSLVDRIVAELPRQVYVTFDIDGLDPSLCPATGTPVPGGLSFAQAVALFEGVVRSGRRIVGFDLCEVGDADWDGNVGARLLYELIGWTAVGAGWSTPPAALCSL